MKFTKKLVSILLTSAMLLPAFGTLPTFAATGKNYDFIYRAESYEADGTVTQYPNLAAAVSYACQVGASVKLLTDCAIDAPLNVYENGNLTIDLNGHKIKRDRENNRSDKNGSVIKLEEKANLTIIDSSESKSGTIEGGGAKWGGGIYAPKDNIVTMDAGTITHCTAYYGGGVYVDESSKFIMNGGKIDHCYATYGGGVYVEDKARFETHGGQITHNFADNDGGGIYVWSAFANLENCYIGQNHASKGGAVYSDYNRSKMYSYITIDGSTIEGNMAQNGYGGIYHNDGGLTLKNETTVVENSTNGKYGGGIYSEKCSITLSGGVYIYGNTANTIEPCDVSFGKDLDSAFKLLDNLSSSSFIGVSTRYHTPKAWYDDVHFSSYGYCNEKVDMPKANTLKDALFSNYADIGFDNTFYEKDEDYSSTFTKRHRIMVISSGNAVYDKIGVSYVTYKNMPLPQSDYSATYDPSRRTIFLRVPKYVKEYSSLNVGTDNEKVTFYRGSRLATSTGWGDVIGTRYGLVIQNVEDSPSYTVSVENGKVDGIEPDNNGISSTKKEFFDELKIEPIVPDDKMFSHWEVEGDYTNDYIIGYNQYIKIPLFLLMPRGNVTFKAVFKDKISTVDVMMFSPEVGKRTPFYVDGLGYPCLKANVVYKSPDGTVHHEDTVNVTWKKRQEMFDGTAIHYFDYYADYLADFQIEDNESGNFSLANYSDFKMNLYMNGELLNSNAYNTRYEYVYGDGSMWQLKNDNNPITQHILHVTRYYTSEKAPIRRVIPSQISVPENISREELIRLLPESVNVEIADISYSNGTEQSEITHSPVKWNTDNLPSAVTERLEITGTYDTAKEGFEVKPGDEKYPVLVVDPITQKQSQMPQVSVDEIPVTVIDGTAKIAYGKKIKLSASMEGAAIYYKLDNDESFTEYTPGAEIEITGAKNDIVQHKIEAYAELNNETSDTLKLNLEVDNKTTYTVKIVDYNGSEYLYCEGNGKYKLGETVSVNLLKRYMDNPWTPSPELEDVYDPKMEALTWSAKGLVLNDTQKKNPIFTFEMPNSDVKITIDTFKNKATVHNVTIVDQDGKTYEHALGAGQYKEGETVTIDSTKYVLRSVDADGIETTEDKKVSDKVVSQWSAEGIELNDKQKTASKFEFTMPYKDVTIKAESFRPLVKNIYLSSIIPVAGKALPDSMEILSATDINGNTINKKDIWLEAKMPEDSAFNGMWADLDSGKTFVQGTIAETGIKYKTLFNVQPTVSGETVTLDGYEMFMNGIKIEPDMFWGPYMIVVETEAIKDELISCDLPDEITYYSVSEAKNNLPKEVSVRTKYGTIDKAKVTWSGTDFMDESRGAYDYPLTATLDLPNYVDAKGNGTKKIYANIRSLISLDGLNCKNGKIPARAGEKLPDGASSSKTDTDCIEFSILNKNGENVCGQTAVAGEEYTVKAKIQAKNRGTTFSYEKTSIKIGGKPMEILSITDGTGQKGDICEVSYTFTAEDVKSYEVIVNGSLIGKHTNGDTVEINAADTAFDRWTAEAVYTTTETVTEGEGESATQKEIEVEHRNPVNLFKDGAEYSAKTSFVMPLLVDDSAKLELTPNYNYGTGSYDEDTRTANIVADKEYKDAKVIFATYRNNNKLMVKTASLSLNKGSNSVSAPEGFSLDGADKLKIMVWSGFDGMTPLFEAFEQTYEVNTESKE